MSIKARTPPAPPQKIAAIFWGGKIFAHNFSREQKAPSPSFL
jgi:hypothetical protein